LEQKARDWRITVMPYIDNVTDCSYIDSVIVADADASLFRASTAAQFFPHSRRPEQILSSGTGPLFHAATPLRH